MENRELYHLGGNRLVNEAIGTSRPVRSVSAILDDGALEIAMVRGRSAVLVHVDDSPPSGLK